VSMQIPWWHMNLASPADQFWKEHATPAKGEFGGPCYNAACEHAGAEWYNRSSGRYYCEPCAREVNRLCRDQGMPKLCELHI
jgi:hypothetical protein